MSESATQNAWSREAHVVLLFVLRQHLADGDQEAVPAVLHLDRLLHSSVRKKKLAKKKRTKVRLGKGWTRHHVN
jgi:hypothetical protein